MSPTWLSAALGPSREQSWQFDRHPPSSMVCSAREQQHLDRWQEQTQQTGSAGQLRGGTPPLDRVEVVGGGKENDGEAVLPDGE